MAGFKVPYKATGLAEAALARIGRTEDVKWSPDGRRIAIAGFQRNAILLLDVDLSRRGGRTMVHLSGAQELTSPALSRPHGLSFISDQLLLVANREASAPLLHLPPEGGTAPSDVPAQEPIPGKMWLHSPGSVCNYRDQRGNYQVLICNNYANYITRHELEISDTVRVRHNELLLARDLGLPDGIAVSPDARWIAVSNHDEQTLRIYSNDAKLNRFSAPDALLHGTAYPHGLVFSRDGRHLLVADAGAPFLRIYSRNGRHWQGEQKPLLSLRLLDDSTFLEGHHNPMEGGVKGVDLQPESQLLVTSAEQQPLAFFDLETVMSRLAVHQGRTSPTLSRGSRCPCGSKKAFGKCCGSQAATRLPGDPGGGEKPLRKAVEMVQAEKYERAGVLARRELERHPGDVKAQQLLGFVLYKQQQYREAMALLRQAGSASGWRDLSLRHHYALALGARLYGASTTAAARLRIDYRRAVQNAAQRGHYRPLVSVVVACTQGLDAIETGLRSVSEQTYPKLEVVLVYHGESDQLPEGLTELLTAMPFPCRCEQRPALSLAAALNEAVRLARGDYVNPLAPGDCFGPDRIATLVESVAQRGGRWGFTDCALVDDRNELLHPGEHQAVAFLNQAVRDNGTAATVGDCFLGMANPAVCLGNLFFERSLHRELDGFCDRAFHLDWDFCLRALWLAEPRRLPAQLYRHQLLPRVAAGEFTERGQREVQRLFATFCERAERETPVNPFAPSRATRGAAYLVYALSAGHSRLPPAVLTRMEDELNHHPTPLARPADLPGQGLNLVGYFRGDLALGENVRGMARWCPANDIPVRLHDAGVNLGARQSVCTFEHLMSDDLAFRNTLVYVNPDQLEGVLQGLQDQDALAGRRIIGLWHWEIDQYPRAWRPALERVDEIWTTSTFVQQLIARDCDKPVIKIPHAINAVLSRRYRRQEFGLADNRFLFLFSFDFSSYTSRKNPAAVIDAFKSAFPGMASGVGLVIKSVNGDQFREQLEPLLDLVRGDSRITLLDCKLSREDMTGLQSVCDCFVSLHRAEGLGLGLAESMALGKPVIATGYSGNLEFMNPENSCLVDHSLIPVKPGEYPHYEGGWMWAEPDLEDAARHMVRMVQDPGHRERLAQRAARDMAQRYTPAVMCNSIKARLLELEQS